MTNALLNNLANELESYTEDSDISAIYEKDHVPELVCIYKNTDPVKILLAITLKKYLVNNKAEYRYIVIRHRTEKLTDQYLLSEVSNQWIIDFVKHHSLYETKKGYLKEIQAMKLHQEDQEAKTKKEIEEERVRKEDQEVRAKFIEDQQIRETQLIKKKIDDERSDEEAKRAEEFIKLTRNAPKKLLKGKYAAHKLTAYELRKRINKKKKNRKKVKKLISNWNWAETKKEMKRKKALDEFLSRPHEIKETHDVDIQLREDQQIREIQLIKKKIDDKRWFDSISEKNSEDINSSVEEWQSNMINKNETSVDEPTQDFSTCPRCNGTGGINESCKFCGGKGFI